MRANPTQTNFTGGELSPRLWGRTDIQKYASGAKRLINAIVLPQGGATRRPGTRYVDEVKTSANATILVPFTFSNVQSYVLEFGNLYMRIYKDGALVKVTGTPVEVTTPYATADLPQLRWTQSADVLYLTHPGYQPRKITRTSHTDWSISLYPIIDGPYLDFHAGDLSVARSTDTTQVTASPALFTTGSPSPDIGKLVQGSTWNNQIFSGSFGTGTLTYRYYYNLYAITAVASTTVATCDILRAVPYAWKTHGDWSAHIINYVLSGTSVTSDYATFDSSSIGAYVRITASGVWRAITAVSDSTHCTVSATTYTVLNDPYTSNLTTVPSLKFIVKGPASTFVSTDVGRCIRWSESGAWRGASSRPIPLQLRRQ